MDITEEPDMKKSGKLMSSLEQNIMGTVRPRKTNGWTTQNRQRIKNISNTFNKMQLDSTSTSYKKPTIEDFSYKSERTAQNYNLAIKDKQNISGYVNINYWTRTLNDYCEKCSLHGLKYVGDLQLHPFERIFWAVAFLLAVGTATYFISFLYQKWDESPVIVSIGATVTQLIDIPFPAVTMCTMNKVKKSVARQINESSSNLREARLNKTMLKNICRNNFETYENNIPVDNEELSAKENWDKIQNFMTYVRQPCHEMIRACSYAGYKKTCDDIFNPSLTDEGICCSFNKVKRELIFRNPRDLSDLNVTFPTPSVDWTPESGYPPNTQADNLPWRPRGSGSHLGLTILLDANVDEYYCSSTAGFGFKIRLHSPVETPKLAEFGFLVSPGKEYRVALKPTIFNASSSLRRIPQHKRQCVFSNEKILKFYRTYTQRNCALECETNYTLDLCGCVPYYLPKDANTTICGRMEENCTISARKAIEMLLVDASANASIFDSDEKRWIKPNCQCLPGCSELSYRGTLSSSEISGSFSIDQKYNEFKNGTYFRQNMAVVHVFFTDTQFMNYYKSELFGFTEFLSNTGGLLGLFLGFSFLSAVEAIYFLSVRLWFNIVNKRQPCTNQQSSILLENSNNINVVTPYPFAQ